MHSRDSNSSKNNTVNTLVHIKISKCEHTSININIYIYIYIYIERERYEYVEDIVVGRHA